MDWDRTDADWAKPPDERKSYFTMSEENNYTIWAFLKKCHGKGLIYRGYDVMPWCGRCGVGISEMEMKEGYKWVEHKACFVKFPLKGRDEREPARLDDDAVDADEQRRRGGQPGADLPQGEAEGRGLLRRQGRVQAEPDGGAAARRTTNREPEASEASAKKSKREWLDGVPHLNSIEQHFKSKAGKDDTYEIVGEVKGADMLGWEYVGPFDDLPGAEHEYGFPEEVAKVTKQSGQVAREDRGAVAPRHLRRRGRDRDGRYRHRPHRAGLRCDRLRRGARRTACRRSRRSATTASFVEGFGPLTGKNAADPTTADAVFEELKKKDRALRDRALRPPLPALLAVQDGTALPPRR